jgi:hypothetical protein
MRAAAARFRLGGGRNFPLLLFSTLCHSHETKYDPALLLDVIVPEIECQPEGQDAATDFIFLELT